MASTLPSAITMTREHNDMTNSMLCSITTKVARCSRLIAARRSFELGEHGEVDAAGGFVEQDQPRPAHECHGGIEQLLLAVGQAASGFTGEMVELEELDHPIGDFGQACIGGTEQPGHHAAPMLLSGKNEIFAY